ncbi:MAG: transcription elongation factor GreA, partial [Clostridiales bacterium]|nr:transcription elongation factor GreA [Clostridiales bacterium]
KLQVAEEIKLARGHGDLSENAEYAEAKNAEARVYGRIAEVENTLKTGTFVDDSHLSTDVVAIGNAVRADVEYGDETVEETYTLVGFTETDPKKLYISGESPIGKALMGARVGNTVEALTPGGTIRLKVLEISKPDRSNQT